LGALAYACFQAGVSLKVVVEEMAGSLFTMFILFFQSGQLLLG
jgi:hypothetical protein